MAECVAVVDVVTKQRALATRRDGDARLQKEVDALYQLHVKKPVDAAAAASGAARPLSRVGCLGRFVCPARLFGSRRVSLFGNARAVETAEAGAAARQAELPVEAKLAAAAAKIQARVDELGRKHATSRARAIELKTTGRGSDALREMRRLKGIQAQQAAAQKAMDAIDAQQAALEQTTLQRELATALQTSSVELKGRAAGLIEQTEDAIDDAVELQDDVRDAADALQNMKPTYGGFDVDEDELVAELDALVGESAAARAPRVDVAACRGAVSPSAFPSAPTFRVDARDATSERRRLLAPASQ